MSRVDVSILFKRRAGIPSHLIEVQFCSNSDLSRIKASSPWGRICAVLLFCLSNLPLAHAAATLLLEEPYSYDGTFAGTGHSAVYLSNVCSVSPVVLRPCAAGESGVVLSRYDGIAGYDWIAIPLLPYLYAVDRPEDIPLFADAKLVDFLRDQYRRDHWQALVPDRPDGGKPEGNWYELVGSSYARTIYGFEIETNPKQDALLIEKFNQQPNHESYNFVRRNCADFVREVIDFYYPHALHRSVIGDLGVTTPKQIAKMLLQYSHHHAELQSSNFIMPQVPGTVRRSKPVHGVLESVMAAKKYMLPLVVLHPYIGGGLLAEYFGHKRFDPARKALILDSSNQLDDPMTRDQRVAYQSRMNEMIQGSSLLDPSNDGANDRRVRGKTWEHSLASAQPGFDGAGQPILQFQFGDDWAQVGVARSNLMSVSQSPELAAKLLEARLRQELRPSTAHKTSSRDVDKDLKLFRQLLAPPSGAIAVTPPSTVVSHAPATATASYR